MLHRGWEEERKAVSRRLRLLDVIKYIVSSPIQSACLKGRGAAIRDMLLGSIRSVCLVAYLLAHKPNHLVDLFAPEIFHAQHVLLESLVSGFVHGDDRS